MAWSAYSYQAGPVGGSFTDLLDYCTHVGIVEMDSPKRGSNPSVPYRDGEFTFPAKFRAAGTIMLDCIISGTNSSGGITHEDGEEGHFYENKANLLRLLGGNDAIFALRRSTPHMGDMEAICEYMGGVQPSGPQFRYAFILRLLDGLWREQTLQSDEEASISSFPHAYTIATGGNYKVGDAKLTFTCVADGNAPSFELDEAGDKISIAGAFVASDVIIVDLARDRVITKNGARYASVSPNRAWWLRLPPDDATLDVILDADSGTWTMKVEWRNRWL